MKFYIGVTDNNWFDLLQELNPEDINFWQPSGRNAFRVIDYGSPFLFKLKAPRNAIGGVGFFTSHSLLPIELAWDTFGSANGVESLYAFKQIIANYRSDGNALTSNPIIGCIVLTNPIFFSEEDWIEVPSSWSKNIVQGKSYTTNTSDGQELWAKVEALLNKYAFYARENDPKRQLEQQILSDDVKGTRYWSKIRVGQGAFRIQVTEAYQRRCAISGEKTLPVLEAAHVKSYASSGPYAVNNGILLRSDIHKLYDTGYLTVTPNYKVEVSPALKADFSNGREYYKYHGEDLASKPSRSHQLPFREYIDWHNNNVFKG